MGRVYETQTLGVNGVVPPAPVLRDVPLPCSLSRFLSPSRGPRTSPLLPPTVWTQSTTGHTPLSTGPSDYPYGPFRRNQGISLRGYDRYLTTTNSQGRSTDRLRRTGYPYRDHRTTAPHSRGVRPSVGTRDLPPPPSCSLSPWTVDSSLTVEEGDRPGPKYLRL